MLKAAFAPFACLLLVLGSGCCSAPVRQDPNVEIGRVQQTLIIANAGGADKVMSRMAP